MPPTFADLGVPAALCARLDELGIAEPFPVQAATLPDALAGRDVCGKAPTGSGKTIAFGLPLLANVKRARGRHPRALVLVPTRELAVQVQDQLHQLSAGSGTTVLAVYGGAGMGHQMKVLASGAEVVVATPGRLKDLIDRGSLRLTEVEIVVIDEADRMADMGFLPEVRRLLDQVSPQRQTLLFSATLDGDVDVLIKHYQRDPAHHEAVSLDEPGEVTHRFWKVAHGERVAIATAVVERIWPAIVFTRTKHGADRLAKQMKKSGIRAEAIHGDRSQSQRERALYAFGRGDCHVLVATDVAARGIHVDGVAAVLQYDAPAVDKDYIHRSGRTGRAGADGVVITMTTPEKEKALRTLQRELRRREPIEDVTEKSVGDVLGMAAPAPIDRGDSLDGVPRREQSRADLPSRGTGRDSKRNDRRPSTDRPEHRDSRRPAGQPARADRSDRNRDERRPAGKPARSTKVRGWAEDKPSAGAANGSGGARGEERRSRPSEGRVERVGEVGKRSKSGHRKGANPTQFSEADWAPRTKPAKRKPAAARGATPQGRAGAPARSGSPSAKPGRRPAGAGAARPGRPASGNARRGKR